MTTAPGVLPRLLRRQLHRGLLLFHAGRTDDAVGFLTKAHETLETIGPNFAQAGPLGDQCLVLLDDLTRAFESEEKRLGRQILEIEVERKIDAFLASKAAKDAPPPVSEDPEHRKRSDKNQGTPES